MYRDKLGELVKQRRQELGLSIRAAAKAAGVDRATWTALEEGTRATRDHHYAGIERALEWPTGTIELIISGKHPWIAASVPVDLRDDNERTIWSMDAVDEGLRLQYIRMYREHREGHGEGNEGREVG